MTQEEKQWVYSLDNGSVHVILHGRLEPDEIGLLGEFLTLVHRQLTNRGPVAPATTQPDSEGGEPD